MAVALRVLAPPRTRGDCARGPRPCPWRACRYHLEPTRRGPGRPRSRPSSATCALDVADQGEHTVPELAEVLGVSERTVELEAARAAAAFRQAWAELIGVEADPCDWSDMDMMLTPEEVAVRLAVDGTDVLALVRRGELTGVIVGGRLRIPAASLRRLLIAGVAAARNMAAPPAVTADAGVTRLHAALGRRSPR